MSNFYCKIKIKQTGEIKEVESLDNYFGHREYGYKTEDGIVYREDDIEFIDD